LVDLADYPLPHLDEPGPAVYGDYENAHTVAWSERISEYDGFVFVTPEYNHSTSGVLKNALDYLFKEWNNKAAAFVSYGGVAGGARAVEHLRLVASELQLATVRAQVAISILTEFKDYVEFAPNDYLLPQVDLMIDQLLAWSSALEPLRASRVGVDSVDAAA
jgi:NAD(P)H-dependent FMN reductase